MQSTPGEGMGLVDLLLKSMDQNCSHIVRVHMEIFAALLCREYPAMFVPLLLGPRCLGSFNLSQQSLASYFVLVGHLGHAGTEVGRAFSKGNSAFWQSPALIVPVNTFHFTTRFVIPTICVTYCVL